MAQIFFSYAKKDSDRVRPIIDALIAQGFSVWWDNDLLAGDRWTKTIERELKACDCVVVAWSEASVQSEWVELEAYHGKQRRILCPFFLDPVTPPFQFTLDQAENLVGWSGDVSVEPWRKLLAAIGAKARVPAGPGVASEGPVSEEKRAAASLWKTNDFEVFRDGPHFPEMVALPGGTFLMGSPDDEDGRYDNEGPQHEVTISPFAIGRYPVTFDEYGAFCGATGRAQPPDEGWGRARRPVINVDWHDALAFCHWLSGVTGSSYRLPTEAEWEYACRAGTVGATYAQNGLGHDDIAWWARNSGGRTQTVGGKQPNGWGLHDTLGNVWEWCADGLRTYDQTPMVDPVGRQGPRRAVRGGSWYDSARGVRAARRYAFAPGRRNNNLGFRCARGRP